MLAVLLASMHRASMLLHAEIRLVSVQRQTLVHRTVDQISRRCASRDLEHADMTAAIRKRRY